MEKSSRQKDTGVMRGKLEFCAGYDSLKMCGLVWSPKKVFWQKF